MKLVCAPDGFDFSSTQSDLNVTLYGHSGLPGMGSVGAAVKDKLALRQLAPASRAWDLLSLALSAVTADLAGHRDRSPDGWTREYDLTVSVADPCFWNDQHERVERILEFLTTDRWAVRFIGGGYLPKPPVHPIHRGEDCVVLLSGGLDSFIGAIDLARASHKPLAISELVRGDADNQRDFATAIGNGLTHIQLHHNATVPDPEIVPTQRARSFIFLAYGVIAATSLALYHTGGRVDLNICENGFIAVNPPLTPSRVGSLSTRTTHPVVLGLFQELLTDAGLRVNVGNPYRFKTKGEMLSECLNQTLLEQSAHLTTSCGRFLRFGYMHCGRCVPCLVRRAAFRKWGKVDSTSYKFSDLSIPDADHAAFDDVRAAAMAVLVKREVGLNRWLGASLSSPLVQDKAQLAGTVDRGLEEVAVLLTGFGIL